MRHQRAHPGTLPTQALLGTVVALWFSTSSAAEPGGPGIRYGWFDEVHTAADLVDASALDTVSDVLDADKKITWRVYVPETYDPDEPAGLMVYISPTGQGRMPSGWQPVFDEQNLIFVSANRSGNRTPTKRRITYAALAPYVLSGNYQVDPGRIYVSGFSGGGKAASIAAISFANLFSGAIYICGVEFWDSVSPTLYSTAKSNRYVFLTGGRDFNRTLTGNIYADYERAGFANISLLSIPSMGHDTPDREHFEEAMRYLDARGLE